MTAGGDYWVRQFNEGMLAAGMYALLDRAVAERDPDVLQVMNAVPILHPIRGEPRYQRLLERIGLPADLR